MPALSSSELAELRTAVSVHGRAWDRIIASGACRGRDARSLRHAWDAFSQQGVVSAAVVVAEPGLHPLVHGPVDSDSPLPSGSFDRAARCIHTGRPWDYIVQRGGPREAPRVPTALQWQYDSS